MASISCSAFIIHLDQRWVAEFSPRVQTLDILEVDQDGWYEAKTSGNVQAVLSIVKA